MRMVFFIMFPLLLFIGLGYVLWHIWHILPLLKWAKWLIIILLAACPLSMFFMFGGAFERWPLPAASVAYHVNTSSVFILLYLLITFLVLDICRLLHIVPKSLLFNSWAGTLGVTLLMVVVFVAGNIKYHNKVRVPLELTTKKHLPHDYRIVMVSDLHLGYHNRRGELAKWVDLINAEKPDMVLIGGDVIDNSIRPLAEEKMAEEFHRIKAPIYACLGNHEYPWSSTVHSASSDVTTAPIPTARNWPRSLPPSTPHSTPLSLCTSPTNWRRPNRARPTSSSAATPTADRCGPSLGLPMPSMNARGVSTNGATPVST